jgi:PAS domain S-box-containing protein
LNNIQKTDSLKNSIENLQSIQNRLSIEHLLTDIAREFIQVQVSDIDNRIEDSLKKISLFLKVDRFFIFYFRKNETQLHLLYHYTRPDIKEKNILHERSDSNDFSWLINTINNKQIIGIPTIEALPQEAQTIKMIMEEENTKSTLLSPIVSKDKVIGIIGMDSVRQERQWTEESKYLLKRSSLIFRDAINRKQIDFNELQSEQRLRYLFSRIEDVIFISTPNGKIIEINPAGAKLLGYDSVEEIFNLDVRWDLYEYPEERLKFQQEIEKHGQIKDFELTLRRKDGKKIIVLETATAVYDDNKHIAAYEGIFRDVTDQRLLERQLFQSQKMESIGLLAGGVAHDFNNILTAIKGYADILKLKMGPTHDFYNSIESIIKAADRAEDLTKQLLGFSRKQMIKPKVTNINKEIKDLNKMLSRLITEDIHFELKLTDGIKNIKADPGQIQQILVNLIVNAVYAIRDTSKSSAQRFIHISTGMEVIDKRFTYEHPGIKQGLYILFSVNDSGIGMTNDTIDKIFEPFFTTKEKGKGTGLGLSTVYGIVKQNNGAIYAESDLDSGTTFTVYWPVTEEQEELTLKTDSKLRIIQHSETILVVEDDDIVRDLACTSLKSFGYKIFEANNGKNALTLIEEQNLGDKIDLLFTDMIMPEMSGEKLIEHVIKINPDIKILLSSGYTDSRYFNDTDRNEHFMLNKPYTIQKLEKMIQKILNS